MNNTVNLGTGRLTWNGSERRTDRYGTVWLMPDGERSNSLSGDDIPSVVDVPKAKALAGTKGRLVAKVTATRESTHIGDLFRGIGPRTPEIGAEIVLGTGTLFTEPNGNGVSVGLEPDDGRPDDWLDPRALYDAHEQTVELSFQPVQ